jgi:hypothetical protein
MFRAKAEIGQNANYLQSLGKMSYFGFLPGKTSYDILYNMTNLIWAKLPKPYTDLS